MVCISSSNSRQGSEQAECRRCQTACLKWNIMIYLSSAAVSLVSAWPSPVQKHTVPYLMYLYGKKMNPLHSMYPQRHSVVSLSLVFFSFSEQPLCLFPPVWLSTFHYFEQWSGISLTWIDDTSNWFTMFSENLMPLASLGFLNNWISHLNCLNNFTLYRHVS